MEPIDLSPFYFFDGIADFKPLSKLPSKLPQIGQMISNLPQVSFNSASVDARKELAVKAEAIPETAGIFVSKPEVKIVEDKVFREWYVDDAVQR